MLLKAAAADPANAVTFSNLGVALQKQGRTAEAIGCYERAIALDPNSPETQANFAMALGEAGRKDEAIAHYRTALRLRPDWPEVATALHALVKRQENR